jgi:hypothetical protein
LRAGTLLDFPASSFVADAVIPMVSQPSDAWQRRSRFDDARLFSATAEEGRGGIDLRERSF